MWGFYFSRLGTFPWGVTMYTQQHIPIISGRMGKKKKGKKGKGKKKKSSNNDAEEYVIPFEIEPVHKIVTIKPLLLHWSFSKSLWPKRGFEIDVSKTVGTLKRIIARRHGSVESIKLWKIVKAPQNLLEDDRMTLAECGFVGRGKEVVKSPLAHLVKGPPTKVAGSDDEDEGEQTNVQDEEQDGSDQDNNEEDNDGEATDKDEEEEEDDDPSVVRVIYDFVPTAVKSPLLLLSPRGH